MGGRKVVIHPKRGSCVFLILVFDMFFNGSGM